MQILPIKELEELAKALEISITLAVQKLKMTLKGEKADG